MKCTLCEELTQLYFQQKEREYYRCINCDSILLHPKCFLDFASEKERYDKHSDDILDKGYQNFVKPLIEAVESNFDKKNKGLDFGCGKTAIVQFLLKQKGYKAEGYDPIYFPNHNLLKNQQYNYITSCEVVEHFYNPKSSFELLYNLLLPGGKLFIKTNLFSEDVNFKSWWYKNDPTHVAFYTEKSFKILKEQLNFSGFKVSNSLIEFTK